MARRVGAIFIDWLLCGFVAAALVRPHTQLDIQLWTLAIFALQDYLLTALTGFTIGKRLLSIRVVRFNNKIVGLGWALVRTLLLLTVIPALIVDRDLRGLHDRAANTAVVRV
jgi:uncharacterized RDD family membrane protein YckC